MSRHCQVTGAVPGFGRNVPWSKKKTARRFDAVVADLIAKGRKF